MKNSGDSVENELVAICNKYQASSPEATTSQLMKGKNDKLGKYDSLSLLPKEILEKYPEGIKSNLTNQKSNELEKIYSLSSFQKAMLDSNIIKIDISTETIIIPASIEFLPPTSFVNLIFLIQI